MGDDDLIVIKRSKVKKTIGQAVKTTYNLYLKVLRATSTFWIKLFIKNKRITPLLENEGIILFLNVVLFAFFGLFFGGVINQILFLLAASNILILCLKLLGILDKIVNWA